MNIKQAKEQIKNAMTAYFTKDEFGNYRIPIEKQRPVFLMGPPGIGKTAIMEQIAAELGVGLVSYSMTHHTRQSALGLPFIEKKTYGGQEYRVSEYTMSEIIASVYDMIEATGLKEGILFLDEINCVSQTLAPAMLQFLQYKVFGKHRVPDGWIVVTAGNPPEYNNSVHEFDVVTWDRLKRIDVEPDYATWKEYAYKKQVHPAILTYLDIKKSNFYSIETTVDGKSFVTARGWSDLSDMLKLYEENNLPVDLNLVGQYLQDKAIAKEFAVYYDLFNKYRSDYQVDKILAGTASAEIMDRAMNAQFDERLSLLGLILDGVTADTKAVFRKEQLMLTLLGALKDIKASLPASNSTGIDMVNGHISKFMSDIQLGKVSSTLSPDKEYALRGAVAILEDIKVALETADFKDSVASTVSSAGTGPVGTEPVGTEAFAIIKNIFDEKRQSLKADAKAVVTELSNVFAFAEQVFKEGQEMLILVTELTRNYYCSYFISRYGCKEYFAHNKELLFYQRQKEIIQEIEALDL